MVDCLVSLKKDIPETNTNNSTAAIQSSQLRWPVMCWSGGKGVCDRKAAIIKGDIGRCVNEGNVINALQFKTVIESGQETTGVKASYVASKPLSTSNVKGMA